MITRYWDGPGVINGSEQCNKLLLELRYLLIWPHTLCYNDLPWDLSVTVPCLLFNEVSFNQNLFLLILETSLESSLFAFYLWLQYDNRGLHLEILLPESICDVHYNLDLLEQQYYLSWEPVFSPGYYPGVILTFYRISFWSAYSVSSQGSLKLYQSLI